MPSYAILGATGNTGQALLKVLSKSPNNHINVYARSKAKLLRLDPDLTFAANVTIFEGDLHDVSVICDCISGTSAAFLVVAVSDNVPGTSIARDTAQVVVSAMRELRSRDPAAKLARLVVLSSSSLNPYISRHFPAFVHWLLWTASSNVYADLAKAEEYLREQQDWIHATFIQPGGLVHDEQKGHELSLETEKTFLSYLDLAAGMVEVADEEGNRYDWKGVSVLPTAGNVKIEWKAPIYLLKGLICNFFPWTYPYLKS